jgi:aspartokinase-like uncharacterized kinase
VDRVVVKVGGSLFDLPDLGPRLQRFLIALAPRQALLVPGGGPTADVVRDLDRRHGLGEDKAHWLALRALALNAHILADLLPAAEVIADFDQWPAVRRSGRVPVLDAHAFARHDERSGKSALPHRWAVTSDAVAARVAVVARAPELILLKSVTIPPGMDWAEAARHGLVDEAFAGVLAAATHPPQTWTVNLRQGDS